MARVVTLLTLRTRLRRRADIEGETARFPDAELNDYINEGIAALHTEILRERPQGFGENQTTFSTVYNQELYPLPVNFMNLTKVFVIINGFEHVLRTYEQFDTNGLVEPVNWDQIINPVYRIVGDQISLRPRPSTVMTVYVNYVPCVGTLVADSDTFDGVDGFEEVALGWALKQVSVKQGDDQRMGMANDMYAGALDRLRGIMHAKNAAEPARMTDMRGGALQNHRWRQRRWPLP